MFRSGGSSRRIVAVSSDLPDEPPVAGYSGVGAAASYPLLADAYLANDLPRRDGADLVAGEEGAGHGEVVHRGVLRTELSDDEYRPIAVGFNQIFVAVMAGEDVLAAKHSAYETVLDGMIAVGFLSRQKMFLQRCALTLARFNARSLGALGVIDIEMEARIKGIVSAAFDEMLNRLKTYACLDLGSKHGLTNFSDSMCALQGYFLLRSTVVWEMERLANEELDGLQRFATHDQIGALNSGQFFARRALISWLLQALFLRSRGSALAELPMGHVVYRAAGAGVAVDSPY